MLRSSAVGVKLLNLVFLLFNGDVYEHSLFFHCPLIFFFEFCAAKSKKSDSWLLFSLFIVLDYQNSPHGSFPSDGYSSLFIDY
jgi:hypothetical protein